MAEIILYAAFLMWGITGTIAHILAIYKLKKYKQGDGVMQEIEEILSYESGYKNKRKK